MPGFRLSSPTAPAAHRRGSVLVIVLITIVFATTALLLFIERASNDLLVEAREADAQHLQMEAYSAMETTLGVLHAFREVGDGLRSPLEGWGAPLEWIGYEPGEGRTVEVAFVDESGKLSLPRLEFERLVELFEALAVPEEEAERLADALLVWMNPEYVPRSALTAPADAYARASLPFVPPARPLRSFAELRSIDFVRERFFDKQGEPTDLGRGFMAAVSLYDFERPNINAAGDLVLTALGGYSPFQQRQLNEFRRGEGAYANGVGYFRDAGEVATILGEYGVAAGFGADIAALRVVVTVRAGTAAYTLEAVVAPPGGAKAVAPVAPEEARPEEDAAEQPRPDGTRETDEASAGLDYPFTILEIREYPGISSATAGSAPDLRPNLL